MKLAKALLITCTLSLNAHGETDTFDMTLSGDFSRDYCELSFNYSHEYVTYPIHPTENLPFIKKQNTLDSNITYYKVQEDRWDLDCSQGKYTITASTLGVSPFIDSENKFKAALEAEVGGSYWTGGTTDRQFIDAANPIPLTPEFDGSGDGFYYIKVSSYILPLDGKWENSGTEFSFNFSLMLTIEKLD